jgi:hypothetical protein
VGRGAPGGIASRWLWKWNHGCSELNGMSGIPVVDALLLLLVLLPLGLLPGCSLCCFPVGKLYRSVLNIVVCALTSLSNSGVVS